MSHKYRLYPDPAQEAVLVQHCTHARAVWNVALEQFGWGTSTRRVDIKAWDRQLAEARTEVDWLRAGSSSVQQARSVSTQRSALLAHSAQVSAGWAKPERLAARIAKTSMTATTSRQGR